MLTTIPLQKIYPNPDQPRKHFNQTKLEELAASIHERGIIEPLVVTLRGNRYMLIAGERRWRASHIAKVTDVPARIIEADDAKVEELALIENIQREDLNLIEEARGYQALLKRMTPEEVAVTTGMNLRRIHERLSLLNLAPDFQDAVIKEILSPSQGYEISRLPRGQQTHVFAKIRDGKLETYNKLRAYVTALLTVDEHPELFSFTAPTGKQKAAARRFESLIEKCAALVGGAYDENQLISLKAVGNIRLRLEQLDLIIGNLQKIRRVLTEGAMQRDVVKRRSRRRKAA